jgi:hypothetical protein
MNNNINIAKILKNCPHDTKFYSTVHGEIFFKEIIDCASYPLSFVTPIGVERFTAKGRLLYDEGAECILFPSKDQRDWSKFTAPWYKVGERFDPKTLSTFDKVLVRNSHSSIWHCDTFINIRTKDTVYTYNCVTDYYKYCIPYNNDTKHLVGTTAAAPEYYKY